MDLTDTETLRDAGPGARLIMGERMRQVGEEGWTPEHDDTHVRAELVDAAQEYLFVARTTALSPDFRPKGPPSPMWPWESDWYKPAADPISNLVKAGALIAAEIDRLKRAKGA